MAIRPEELLDEVSYCDYLESLLDSALKAKGQQTLSVSVTISRHLKYTYVLEILKDRYLKAGWKTCDFKLDSDFVNNITEFYVNIKLGL